MLTTTLQPTLTFEEIQQPSELTADTNAELRPGSELPLPDSVLSYLAAASHNESFKVVLDALRGQHSGDLPDGWIQILSNLSYNLVQYLMNMNSTDLAKHEEEVSQWYRYLTVNSALNMSMPMNRVLGLGSQYQEFLQQYLNSLQGEA